MPDACSPPAKAGCLRGLHQRQTAKPPAGLGSKPSGREAWPEMKSLSDAEIQAALVAMQAASAAHLDGERGAFDRWLESCGNRPARLEFPLGELMNKKIIGSVWAWYMRDSIRIEGITRRDRFNAQGIEGKAVIEVDLCSALLVARDLPKHRVAVYVERQASGT